MLFPAAPLNVALVDEGVTAEATVGVLTTPSLLATEVAVGVGCVDESISKAAEVLEGTDESWIVAITGVERAVVR